MRFGGLKSVLVAALIAGTASGAMARDMTPAERMSDFDQLTGMLGGSYGMLQYKKQKLGIDFPSLVATYKPKVAAVANDQAFYELMHAFIAEFHDAHLGIYNPSTMNASLGFYTRRIEGKAVITAIDRKKLPESTFPYTVGDELVAIDGKPVATQVREWVPFSGNGREESAVGALFRSLTNRGGWSMNVPTGTARVEVRKLGETEIQAITMPWIVTGQALPGLSFLKSADATVGPKAELQKVSGKGRHMGIALAPMAATLPAVAGIPAWGPHDPQAITSELYTAAMFDSEKGPIGYLRIPSFTPPKRDLGAALTELRRILKEMRMTRGLVIDLNDNPGGSVSYVEQLAGLLTDKPLDVPSWSQRASRKTLSDTRQMIDNSEESGENSMLSLAAKQIEDAMNAGQDMTAFGFIWGTTSQAPDTEVTYTKPILILINDQCYSGGDMFPSLMQDNGRAKLFGVNTAGAGGSVNDYGNLSYSGLNIHITETIWQRRPTGTYIENEGAHPDLPYEISQQDVAAGYKAYRSAYTKALLDMIK